MVRPWFGARSKLNVIQNEHIQLRKKKRCCRSGWKHDPSWEEDNSSIETMYVLWGISTSHIKWGCNMLEPPEPESSQATAVFLFFCVLLLHKWWHTVQLLPQKRWLHPLSTSLAAACLEAGKCLILLLILLWSSPYLYPMQDIPHWVAKKISRNEARVRLPSPKSQRILHKFN